ncbi:MAG: alkaline phosphatase family protein [Anaerolineae bacterium]|nr:alkaline phosphatase family protein [Anaerolineae bacterium]
MGLFRRLRRSKARRVCLIGLDCTPHSLLERMMGEGVMPHMAELARNGSLRRMNSVYPWVSSVAWASFMTGQNPARHGIFGFIDRDPATLKTFIPTATHMKSRPLWQILGDAGKRVVVVNVPVTYPPQPVNGVLISCFLSPSLEKAVYPPSLLPKLQELGYRIDPDPWLARESREKAWPDLWDALEKRTKTLLYLLDHEPWDFFMGVIMETDRLHHFWFELMEQNDSVWAPKFFELYRYVDEFIGQVRERLGEADTLMLMSDHGICSIKKEVFYNRWLHDAGYLRYSRPPEEIKGPDLEAMHPDSVAYSLDPGRIFLNLKGRERDGSVEPADYERVREEIAAAAEVLTDPDSGEKLVRRAYRREELYRGPYLEQAADLILAPVDGYDPKGALWKPHFTHKDQAMVGMHTYDDAFLYIADHSLPTDDLSILDAMPTVLQLLDVPLPADLDGCGLIR